jgi:hypothetical protein
MSRAWDTWWYFNTKNLIVGDYLGPVTMRTAVLGCTKDFTMTMTNMATRAKKEKRAEGITRE